MYQYSIGRTCKICTSTLNQIAIIEKIFPRYKFNLYKELYKHLPENTIGKIIIKLRFMHNLEREELGKLLNFHCDTLKNWELNNIMPKPENIIKLY